MDASSMDIGLSRVHFPVTTLGPGQRLGIWFQGCSIRCQGCISADTWGVGKSKVSIPKLLERITPWLECCDGVTVSGGEPFDQPQALLALLAAIRQRSSVDILVYSGYPMERISDVLTRAHGLIDALMSDPYKQDEPQTRALRGSDNQHLHLLTHLGRRRFVEYERPLRKADQALDLMFDDDGSVWLAGIPRRDDVRHLRELLESQGHQLQISQHQPRRR